MEELLARVATRCRGHGGRLALNHLQVPESSPAWRALFNRSRGCSIHGDGRTAKDALIALEHSLDVWETGEKARQESVNRVPR